ncbi:unnamed protein product [Heligmosomoides polygyrus]|uniref:DDE_3 domain-containing protein n=1 Tax=Heligmosomoides polygyrus TaxID=6339 RepID=A0A183FXB2_HELPZ|nr:unnamed protein product [Heligmosomoides polygyrus]
MDPYSGSCLPKARRWNPRLVNEIEEMDLRLELIQPQRVKKVLLFDNAAPHREQVTMDKLAQLGYAHMLHIPYSEAERWQQATDLNGIHIPQHR